MRFSPIERELLARGHRYVAGVDEAGRGALAGPVMAAVVVLDLARPGVEEALAEVNDSKKLTPEKRSELCSVIIETAEAVSITPIAASEVDRTGVVKATIRAMEAGVERMIRAAKPDFVLVDYLTLPHISLPQKGIAKGDALCLCIAAASIIAKVTRDAWMSILGEYYHEYGFPSNKGYGTPAHKKALGEFGPSAVHHLSFAPVREAYERRGLTRLPPPRHDDAAVFAEILSRFEGILPGYLGEGLPSS